jgi:hypothetical protein
LIHGKVKLKSTISEERDPSITHKAYSLITGEVIMKNEQVRMWKEAVVVYLKVLCPNHQGLTEAKKNQSRQPVSRPRSETRNSSSMKK